MSIKQFILLLSSCISISTFAQQAHDKIMGKIVTTQNNPIGQASVEILHPADSSIITNASSDSNGNFEIRSVSPGNYLIKISHLSYIDRITSIDKTAQVLNIGDIVLFDKSTSLQEIVVQGRQNRLIEQKSDRMVINVENSILSDGLTALEILKRSPGIQVDDDGNIQMRGKSGVGVLINGKLSYLSAQELANILKGTPSSNLKSVELITNPSAKFDAAGNAGLINIVMKENKRSGINGSVNIFGGAGRKERYGGSAIVHANLSKISMQGSFDYSFRGEEEYRNFERDFSAITNPPRYSQQYSKTNEPLTSKNAKFILDYNIKEDFSIGTIWTGNFGTFKNYGQGYNNVLLSGTNEMISNALSDNAQEMGWNNNNINFNLIKKFGENELSADYDYLYSKSNSDQDLISDFQSTNHQEAYKSWRKGQTPSTTNLHIGKIDYSHRLNENQKIETGWKSSWISTDNNFINDTLRQDEWILDETTSNRFKYHEQIHAVYVHFNYDLGKWDLTGGLRMEHTRTSGIQVTWNQQVDRNYTNWFPNASIGFKPNEKQSWQLSYSRRIERPDYDDLNPFRYYVDAFVFWEGNPYLKPQLAHSFELNHIWNNDLVISLNYARVKDVMTSVVTQVPNENITIRSYDNLQGYTNFGININHTFKPFGFWSMINNANAYHNKYHGSFNDENIDNKQWAATFMSTHIFNMGKGWSGELNGEYETKQLNGMFVQDAYGMVSGGVMKKMKGDRITAKLSVNDIFKTAKYTTRSTSGGVTMRQSFDLDSRIAIFSLTYKLGDNITIKPRKQKNDSEQSRVRGGD